MIATRICPECAQLLTEAMEAIRSHEADILRGLKLNREGYLTEESRQVLAPAAVASFNAAQTAWDAYRQHLDGHGSIVHFGLRRRAPTKLYDAKRRRNLAVRPPRVPMCGE